MKIIFFGLGSIGKRHAQILLKGGEHNLFALRTHRGDVKQEPLAIQELSSWQEVDRIKPDVAFITNPTALHVSTAIECARRGMTLFLEKPIGGGLERLDELLQLIQSQRLVTYVAYVLRFHPIIAHLKDLLSKEPCLHMRVEAASFLPTWRPGRDHRQTYSARKELGGGVLFDLSHEIDYASYLLGEIEQISGDSSRRGNVTVDADDCADMHLQCTTGFASIHLSFLSHVQQRRITLYFDHRTVVADLIGHTVAEYTHNQLTKTTILSIEKEELFKRQMDFFFKNIRNPHMMNNIPDAVKLFRQICLFKEKNNAA
jgi:predicted dehydrogenase